MLATKQPVLKRFWYPTVALEALENQPLPFELLGQKIVLWRDADGKPIALEDRCPHRFIPLSKGFISEGYLRCGYHGWAFDRNGSCIQIPQTPDVAPSKNCQVRAYLCQERYGYVWVCLTDPIADIPHIPEAFDLGYRQIHEYCQQWQCNAFRVAENALDITHVSFVHATTFGDRAAPVAPPLKLFELENGVHFRCTYGVNNPELQQKNLRIPTETTVRVMDIQWLMPCTFTLKIAYPNGLVHFIVGFATPMTDSTCQRIQFCLRNDTEADAKAEDVAAFDRQVGSEDRYFLESTDPDFYLDVRKEQHMLFDKPGLLMRQKLAALLQAAGEEEQCREDEVKLGAIA